MIVELFEMKWRHCEVYLPPAFGALSGASDAYGYNTRSEVTSARRAIGGAEVRGFAYDYAYDPIGNRTSATEYDESGAPLVAEYAANELNQYAARTVPGYAAVRGEAPTNAFVTVDERPAARTGEYFFGGAYADNTASDVWADLEIYAAINPPGTNVPDTVYSVTTSVFVAKTPETFTYDADGNMTSDGRFTYTWNADNRMVMASNDAVVVTYAYDHRGRMVRKDIDHRGTETQSIFYTWDDWNIVREQFVIRNSSFVIHNVWGLDLDGTLQGAGGVGGLLAVVRDDGVFLPAYDANGNITEYVSTNGEVVAHYDYSPFGEQLISSGPLASTFTHRFSTKPWCADTGLVEYQLRKYRPDIGRWVCRDPIGELGGVNLLISFSNAPIDFIDLLGFYEPGLGKGADGRPKKEGQPCKNGQENGHWTCKLVTINGADTSVNLTGGKKEYDMHQTYKEVMKKWEKKFKKWEKTRIGSIPIPPYPVNRNPIIDHNLYNPTLCFSETPQCDSQGGWQKEGRLMFWHSIDGNKTLPPNLTFPDHDCPWSSKTCFEIESRYMTTLTLQYHEPDVSKFNLSTWCCRCVTTPSCFIVR